MKLSTVLQFLVWNITNKELLKSQSARCPFSSWTLSLRVVKAEAVRACICDLSKEKVVGKKYTLRAGL